jgi:putative glutathione S-transferase
MGLLIDGVWHDDWYDTAASGGRFERFASRFRNWVTAEGAPGPSGEGGFAAEAGRYHLYVAGSCPWAHRTLIWRELKGLEDIVSISIAQSRKHVQGWVFEEGEGLIPDHVNGATHLHQIYTLAEPEYSGRVTVPVLWDKKRATIVNNESAEIVRMLDAAFDGVGASGPELYPAALRPEIDALNARIYASLNNGVYRCGFATSQAAYDEAAGPLFETLDFLEGLLAERRYLTGGRLTEADWRLFPTLVRFDLAYHGNFKCNLKRLVDYPNLWGYTRELYQIPGIARTMSIEQIKTGYYTIRAVNPTGIVPLGPEIDFTAPHGRAHLAGPAV